MKESKTNSGILFFLEKIIRSHPLIYFITRYFIRYTNIFEQDANGVSFIKMSKKVNVIDVGASDGKFHNFITGRQVIGSLPQDSAGNVSLATISTILSQDNQISQNEQNTDFKTATSDFLDFSEDNPFGDPENN